MLKKTVAAMLAVLLTVCAVLLVQQTPAGSFAESTASYEIQDEASETADEWIDGLITEIDGTCFLMLTENRVCMQVNTDEETLLSLQAGEAVRVRYNGQVARSVPAQLYAQEVQSLSEQATLLLGCISGVDGADILLDMDDETIILHQT